MNVAFSTPARLSLTSQSPVLCETEVIPRAAATLAMAELLRTQPAELKVADGTTMSAYVAAPQSSGPHPRLMVFQEAYGVNSHIRNVTERFAQQGNVAIAPELFHRTAPVGFEGPYGDFNAVGPHYRAVTNQTAEADIGATYDWLTVNSQVQSGQIWCVGFCMGGRIWFLANSVILAKAAVSFYGGGISPALLDRAPVMKAPMLLIWAGLDKNITPGVRKSITEALSRERKVYVNVEFSNADHGFFWDQRASRQAQAARQAWALTLEFLRS